MVFEEPQIGVGVVVVGPECECLGPLLNKVFCLTLSFLAQLHLVFESLSVYLKYSVMTQN